MLVKFILQHFKILEKYEKECLTFVFKQRNKTTLPYLKHQLYYYILLAVAVLHL